MRAKLGMAALAMAVAAVATVTPGAKATTHPNAATWTEEYITGPDLLDPALHADVFLPADAQPGERFPVILSIGPYFGTGTNLSFSAGPVGRFADMTEGGRIFERGYAYVQVDSRGYGGSDGCYDLGGKGEQADARRAVEWAAAQPWSTGRVGMWGKSYDAWTQVMALAQKPKGLAAAVIQSPILDGYGMEFFQGVHYAAGWYVTPALYAIYDVEPQTPSGQAEEALYPTKGTATNPHCYAQNLTMTHVPDRATPYWQEREISAAAATSTVPVLWSHGFNDVNTKPDNILPVWSQLKGPKRAWLGQWDHVRGNQANLVGRDGFLDEAMAWFDHHLKGKPLPAAPNVEVQDGDGRWRSEAAWPPADARPWSMPVRSGTYRDLPEGSAQTALNGTWTFSPPTPKEQRIAGVPTVTLDVTAVPRANVVAMLYDVDPTGRTRLITRGAKMFGADLSTTFELYPTDWRLPAGHRLGLLLAGTDGDVFRPTSTGTTVFVLGGELSLPLLTNPRVPDLAGGPAAAQQYVPRPRVAQSKIDAAVVPATFPG